MKLFLFLSISFITWNLHAQEDNVLDAFDFWVGSWDAEWKTPNGDTIHAKNVIRKTTGGKVIREQFSDTTNGFFGTSISVFSPADSLWHQAWADNSGGYIDLVGIVEGDIRIFQTKAVTSGENVFVRRMLFYNITPASFDWDWEISSDGGKTWKLAWKIKYVRRA
jgi:hypothetical protein